MFSLDIIALEQKQLGKINRNLEIVRVIQSGFGEQAAGLLHIALLAKSAQDNLGRPTWPCNELVDGATEFGIGFCTMDSMGHLLLPKKLDRRHAGDAVFFSGHPAVLIRIQQDQQKFSGIFMR